MAENVARERGLFVKEKYPMDDGQDLLSDKSQLSLLQADSTAHVRMDAISQESISRYFDLLESTIEEYQLEDCPGQIYNMDETGMPLNPRPPNIIAKSGQKR